MTDWKRYEQRLKRGAAKCRLVDRLSRKIPETLSYEEVPVDGLMTETAIIDSDNYNEKTIISMPGEHFLGGEIVEFADNYWIITSVDPRQEIYAKGKMLQCNYVLKWIEEDSYGNPSIVETHCIVEDGTKLIKIASAQRELCA